MNVFYINSAYDGCCYLRVHLPCKHNNYSSDKPYRAGERLPIKEISGKLQEADIVVFHRAEEQEYHALARMLKAEGKKIVMDNDDTFLLADNHPLANFNANGSSVDSLKRRTDNLDEFMAMCDLVTTTTPTLASEYRKINPNTVILPNCVDEDDWDVPFVNESNKVRIGMVGSVSMEYDYLHLKPVLRELGKRDDVEIVLFGLGDANHRRANPRVTKVFREEYAFWDRIEKDHQPWVKNYQYQEALNEAKLDMMLIPRKDNYFNRCKSNVKWLEASMLEIPVIAQSFESGPYEEITHGHNGILIKDNKHWIGAINALVEDKNLRRKIGQTAKKHVLAHYNILNKAHLWVDAYKAI